MKLRKVVVLFLVASMILSLTSCTRQTATLQEEHTAEKNRIVQENVMKEDSTSDESFMDESSEKEFVQSNEESETMIRRRTVSKLQV